MPNKLSKFWQELKRRNVVRVITVYAGTAFVILELVDILSPSLGLPQWTLNLVLILLIVGFLITVIVSWIYDIQPEGGIVKTKSAEKVIGEDVPKSSNSWRIASYISFVVIVGLIVLNIIPRAKGSTGKELLDKSIAVLPFLNDSPNQEMYFMNGVMGEILDNLCKIEDLRVVSRNSVEQYRKEPKPIPVVAEEMNVGYVLEGSGQRDGNKIRLTVQLLDAHYDQQIWSESYYREISDIFSLQSEIAQLVAKEIEAIITPEEQKLIEKIPTTNLTAYNYYQRGRDEYNTYWLDKNDIDALNNAISLYKLALELDATYAQAYSGLALALGDLYWEDIWNTRVYSQVKKEIYQDSILRLIDIALMYDDKLAEAYFVRAKYYEDQDPDRALEEYNKAIELNPNYAWAYYNKSLVLFYNQGQWIEGFKSALMAVKLEKGSFLPFMLDALGGWYEVTGFHENAVGIYEDLLNLTNDSIMFCQNMAGISFCERDWEGYKNWWLRGYEIDSTLPFFINELILSHLILENADSANYYTLKLFELENTEGIEVSRDFLKGYLYWISGKKELANGIFNTEIRLATELLNAEEGWKEWHLRTLACIYSLKGQQEKAIEFLQQFEYEKPIQLWFIIEMEEYPWFRNLKSDPRFRDVISKLNSRFQEEHEKLRVWLEENVVND